MEPRRNPKRHGRPSFGDAGGSGDRPVRGRSSSRTAGRRQAAGGGDGEQGILAPMNSRSIPCPPCPHREFVGHQQATDHIQVEGRVIDPRFIARSPI